MKYIILFLFITIGIVGKAQVIVSNVLIKGDYQELYDKLLYANDCYTSDTIVCVPYFYRDSYNNYLNIQKDDKGEVRGCSVMCPSNKGNAIADFWTICRGLFVTNILYEQNFENPDDVTIENIDKGNEYSIYFRSAANMPIEALICKGEPGDDQYYIFVHFYDTSKK